MFKDESIFQGWIQFKSPKGLIRINTENLIPTVYLQDGKGHFVMQGHLGKECIRKYDEYLMQAAYNIV